MDAGVARILLNRYAPKPAKRLISRTKNMSLTVLAPAIVLY
jgi:hypothetical protein